MFRTRDRVARLAVSFALAATAQASLAATATLVVVGAPRVAYAQKGSASVAKLLEQGKKAFEDAQYDE
jgi:hypothetical protein